MKLFKWTADLKPKFPNIVEKFLGRKITDGISAAENVSTLPSVNISDEEKAFEVAIALPGLDKKDVKLEICDNCLRISSEKQYDKEERDKNWVRREFGYASFQRIFQIPAIADQERIQAEMKNGILTVKIAKKADAVQSRKKITIQ